MDALEKLGYKKKVDFTGSSWVMDDYVKTFIRPIKYQGDQEEWIKGCEHFMLELNKDEILAIADIIKEDLNGRDG